MPMPDRVITAATAAYLFSYPTQISVNASILADSGGTCVCTTDDLCVTDTAYTICKGQVRNNLITATAAISALSSCLMGIFANLPVGLAPGLGLNAYVSSNSPLQVYLFRAF